MTKASRKRKPLFISSSSRKASSAAISAPPIRGMPNSSFSAIAVPMTSARSQAMIAASQASHSRKIDRPRIGGAAGLRQIAIGGDAEPRRERLQQDRHQVRQQDDRQQRVTELRAAREIGRPVARDPCSRPTPGSRGRGRPAAGGTNGRRWGPKMVRVYLGQASPGAGRGIRAPAGGDGLDPGMGSRRSNRANGHPFPYNDGSRTYCIFLATHLQLHLASCPAWDGPPCREAGGFGRPLRGMMPAGQNSRESAMTADHHPSPARDLQPPGLVQSRRAIGRADRAGRRPDRRRAAARRRRRPDRPAADRADAAIHPVRDPRGPARRPHLAALADGGLGSAARRGAGGNPAPDLARS